jgi:hypothetical protein
MEVDEVKRKKRLAWYLQKRRWTVNDNWKHIIFSHESQVIIRQNSAQEVYRQ